MKKIIKNKLGASTVLTLFVFLILFSPLTFSHTTVSVDLQITHAADWTDPLVDAIKSGVATAWQYSGGAIFNIIGNIILAVGSAFMWMGGNLLDVALQSLVFGMGEKLGVDNFGATVNTLWSVIRDICNLAFIFGFVYVGFMTIIDSHDTNTKKMLAQIIIGALLINFSLFFAKAIIDFSNFTAYKIYLAMAPGANVDNSIGISDAITQQLGVVSLYKAQGGEILKGLFSPVSFWFYIYGFVLLLVVAFSFFAAAFLLISRFVMLVLLMIGAPILFAATVFPQTKQYAEDMWKALIGYSFFAPIYLLLVLISIQVMSTILQRPANTALSDILNNTTNINEQGFLALLLNFGVSMFFVISSITLAQKMSIAGGTMTVNLGNHFRKGAQGFLGRNTVGRASSKALKAYDRANARNSRSWKFAKGVTMAATLGALDDRTTRGIIESGKKAKFGSDYSLSDDKKYAKERQNRDSQIRPVLTLENALAMESNNPAQVAARNAAIERAVRDMSKAQLEEAGFSTINNPEVMRHISNSVMADLEKSDEFTEQQKDQLSSTRRQVITDLFVQNGRLLTSEFGKASIAQLERLGYQFLMDPNNVHALTDSQIKDLEKSKEFTEAEVRNIKTARENRITQLMGTPMGQAQVFADYTNNPADQYQGRAMYKSKKASEIAQLPRAVLMNPAINPHLTAAVLEQIADKKTLNHADRIQIARRLQAPGAIGVDPATLNYLRSPRGIQNWT